MFFDEVVSLFTDIHILSIVLLVVGIVLLALELFVIPGFGVTGILGICCLVGALISHAYISGSLTQFFMLLFLTLVLLAILFGMFVVSVKKGWISKTPFILSGTAVSNEYFEKAEKEIQGLLGKTGVCISKINPTGIILIDGKEYEAFARGGVIEKDCQIVVSCVENSKIIVERKQK